jgi:polysaccharide biosynthesis protein PslG
MRSTKKTAFVLAAALVLALLVAPASLSAPGGPPTAPPSFFGVAPQTPLSEADAERMSAGGIGSLRWPLPWESVQPTANGGFVWTAFDEVVEAAARQGLQVLPVLGGMPRWLGRRYTTLPLANARQRSGWAAFVQAAVERYGPHGEFWREHWVGSADPLPKLPLREWQIWNEANFFYFTTPASPTRYARLVKLSDLAIGRGDPAAKTILAGLFAEPSARPPQAMLAVDFLERLYRVPGIEQSFDGVALHPYAESALDLARMTEELRAVMVENGDRSAGLYLTELGWGSDDNPNLVSFEQGVGFQIREMRSAFRYMIENRHRLNLRAVYWFTWKDIEGACNFCDSTGFFREGERLRPKPAWHAFVRISGGRPRP